MDFVETIRAIAALGITLGLIGLAAYGARRWGPDWLTRLAPARTDARDERSANEALLDAETVAADLDGPISAAGSNQQHA